MSNIKIQKGFFDTKLELEHAGSGGSYQTYTGTLKRFDEYEKMLIFTDGKTIELSRITKISLEEQPG